VPRTFELAFTPLPPAQAVFWLSCCLRGSLRSPALAGRRRRRVADAPIEVKGVGRKFSCILVQAAATGEAGAMASCRIA